MWNGGCTTAKVKNIKSVPMIGIDRIEPVSTHPWCTEEDETSYSNNCKDS